MPSSTQLTALHQLKNTDELLDFLAYSKGEIAQKQCLAPVSVGQYIQILRNNFKNFTPAQHRIIHDLFIDAKQNASDRKKLFRQLVERQTKNKKSFAAALNMANRAWGFMKLSAKKPTQPTPQKCVINKPSLQETSLANSDAYFSNSAGIQTRGATDMSSVMAALRDASVLEKKVSPDLMTELETQCLVKCHQSALRAKSAEEFLNYVRSEIWPNCQSQSFKHQYANLNHPALKALADLIRPREWFKRRLPETKSALNLPATVKRQKLLTGEDATTKEKELFPSSAFPLDFNEFKREDLLPPPGDLNFPPANSIYDSALDPRDTFPEMIGSLTEASTSAKNLSGINDRHAMSPLNQTRLFKKARLDSDDPSILPSIEAFDMRGYFEESTASTPPITEDKLNDALTTDEFKEIDGLFEHLPADLNAITPKN